MPEKNFKKFTSPEALVVLALFVGFGIGAVFTFAATKPEDKKADTTTPVVAKQFYGLGETSQKNGIAFTVNKVSVDTLGNQVFKPGDGNKFVIFEVSVQNNTMEQFPVVPVTQMFLKNTDGTIYNLTPAPVTNPINGGNLPAGESVKGEISFAVPSGQKDIKVYFDSGWKNSTPTIYSISIPQ